jgi:phytanoyl-CoA dioxygenase PhyH
MVPVLSFLKEVGSQKRWLVDVPWALARMLPGYATYLATGTTPARAFSSMRRLYVLTDGRFNDAVSAALGAVRPPYPLDRAAGVLGDMTGSAVDQVVANLDRDGLHMFDVKLGAAVCDEIYDFARRTPSVPRRANWTQGDSVLFDPETSRDSVYDFRPGDLVRCAPLRRLMTDRSILSIAQAYLRSRAVLDVPVLWWSTPGTGRAESSAAQLYHFDMDRLKFLKFFFYITDVTSETGPHFYVRGSHHRKPRALLRDDGRRSDEEIASNYEADRLTEVTGPRGTMFVADTRGFHKGLNLERGHRLVFQIEFANSSFGQNYPRVPVPSDVAAELIEARDRFPLTYSNFDF